MSRLLMPAVAVVLLLSGCGGGSSSTPPVSPAAPVVAGQPRCPDPEAAPASVVDHAADTLPAGATAARLCLHDNHLAWIPPRGLLTTGLDDLVDVVNAQRVHDPSSDLGCGGVGAPAWSIVLQYAGGTRTITGDNGGCWDLLVGATQRVGSRHVWHAYLHALLRQRRAEGPADVVRRPSRRPARIRTDDAFSPLADAGRLTVARVCAPDEATVEHASSLSHAQLVMLRHDFATASTRRTGSDAPCRALPADVSGAVVGVDAWGDPVTVLVGCDTYRMVRPGSDRYVFARLLPRTARMLGSLLTTR